MKLTISFECTSDEDFSRIEQILALVRSNNGCPEKGGSSTEAQAVKPSPPATKRCLSTERFHAAVEWARGIEWTPEIVARLTAVSRRNLLRLVLGSRRCGNCYTSLAKVNEPGCMEASRNIQLSQFTKSSRREE